LLAYRELDDTLGLTDTGADALADAQIVAFSGSPLRFPYRLARGRAGTLFIPEHEAPPNGRYSVTKIFGH
jgi:hypothetical protein